MNWCNIIHSAVYGWNINFKWKPNLFLSNNCIRATFYCIGCLKSSFTKHKLQTFIWWHHINGMCVVLLFKKSTTHVLIYIVKPHLLNFSNSFTHKRLFMIYDNIVYEHQQRIFWCIKLNASLLLYVLNLLNKNFPEWLHFKSEKLKHNILYLIIA